MLCKVKFSNYFYLLFYYFYDFLNNNKRIFCECASSTDKKMSLIRLNRKLSICVLPKVRNFSTPAASEEEEYRETPEYPPILDRSYEKTRERKREAKFDEIKYVKTVEEKQIKLNIPR